MEPRKLAAAIVAILNDGAEKIEKLLAADVDGDEDADNGDDKKKGARPSRAGKTTAGKKGKPMDADDDDDDDDEDDEDEDDDEDEEEGEASEADIVKATRGALKVLDKEVVVKLIKKHGKADKATDVKAALRAKVIDALEQAVIDEE